MFNETAYIPGADVDAAHNKAAPTRSLSMPDGRQ
jgi:hypothetical protein